VGSDRSSGDRSSEEQRFREIFHRAHHAHASCHTDEWLMQPCHLDNGEPAWPLVWSRRNGPWRRTDTLFVGAAPGNAGGRGKGDNGAHATRIPFGGDIAGANLDALLGSVGIDRNDTFLIAALNQLPAAGGGEPTLREMLDPVGEYPNSIALLRDTVVATGARLIVTLGLVGLRALAAAVTAPDIAAPVLPTAARLEKYGLRRGALADWPADSLPLSPAFTDAWRSAWHETPQLSVLPLMHPSGQNMSPYARIETAFYTRMVDARDALQSAVAARFGREIPTIRPPLPTDGIYALPEWTDRIGPRHADLDERWRAKGI
jgi:uracil-DNA glycosylase